eukprot:Skav227720  [mRNA]  locus=scaffold802:73426:80847:+ [translate_table: standard]
MRRSVVIYEDWKNPNILLRITMSNRTRGYLHKFLTVRADDALAESYQILRLWILFRLHICKVQLLSGLVLGQGKPYAIVTSTQSSESHIGEGKAQCKLLLQRRIMHTAWA